MKIFKTEEKKRTFLQTKHVDKPKINMTTKKPKFQTFTIQSNSNDLLTKKINRFKVRKFITTYETASKDIKIGRWTLKEHIQFLKAIDKFGIKWDKIKPLIPSRTPEQIRSHAQKFCNKLKKYKDEELGIDFSKHDINNLKDMINHIQIVNKDFNIVNLFLYISEKIYATKVNKKNKTAKAKNKTKQNINMNVEKKFHENRNIFNNNFYNNININENNINNELNLFKPVNNIFNNYPVNNILITNINFMLTC